MFDYDRNSPDSILAYAKKLEGMTFLDVLEMYCVHEGVPFDSEQVKNTKAKGQLGNFLEKYYFGYDPNGNQEADFKESGVELKQTCIDVKKDGSFTAGERLSVTNISYNDPVETDFNKSHVWEKIRRMLLVHYIRDRSIDRMLYEIRFVNLFTPPKEDLDIIIEDYKKIIGKLRAGKAHEISESDTLYLGACTKGATAEKSTKPQYYGDHTPARKRNFCLKRQYMDYVLHQYVLKDAVPYERAITGSLGPRSFEEVILEKIQKHVGESDRQLCERYDREYNNNKAQWVDLTYRMLGIKGNHAEEFEKANIVVKAIRLEENGKMRESMSFPPFRFCDLVQQEWEDSDIYEYFSETKFLFVVFKKRWTEYVLLGAKFWNMPTADLDGDVKEGWEKVKNSIKQGVRFTIKPNGTVSNNLPGKTNNRVIHVRPHAKKAAYNLGDGFVRGNVEQDANPLPDGRWMTTQSFWINNDYIMEQLEDIAMVKKNNKITEMIPLSAEEILSRLSCFEGVKGLAYNKEAIERILNESFAHRLNWPRERHACLCITSNKEKVEFIYSRNDFSNSLGEIKRYLSPCIINQSGHVVKKIKIKDIWNLMDELADKDPELVACVALVFYHLMNKTYHKKSIIPLGDKSWNAKDRKNNDADLLRMPVFPKDIMRSLNELVGDVILDNDVTVSFEAFVYYWELCFLKDEYLLSCFHLSYDKTREKICNLMIYIADYFMGHLSHGDLLEMFADGTLEKECRYDEISIATKGAVHDARTDLVGILKKEEIEFIEYYRLVIGDKPIKTALSIPAANVHVLSKRYMSKEMKLERYDQNTGNRIFYLSMVFNFDSFEELVSKILSYCGKR